MYDPNINKALPGNTCLIYNPQEPILSPEHLYDVQYSQIPNTIFRNITPDQTSNMVHVFPSCQMNGLTCATPGLTVSPFISQPIPTLNSQDAASFQPYILPIYYYSDVLMDQNNSTTFLLSESSKNNLCINPCEMTMICQNGVNVDRSNSACDYAIEQNFPSTSQSCAMYETTFEATQNNIVNKENLMPLDDEKHLKNKRCKQIKHFPCPYPGCTLIIKRKDDLTRHMRTHSGEKPFKCKLCSKCFSRKDHLRGHERTHTKERPYQCEICSKCFARSDERKRHSKIHYKKSKTVPEPRTDLQTLQHKIQNSIEIE